MIDRAEIERLIVEANGAFDRLIADRDAARAEVAAMRPVVEAAERVVDRKSIQSAHEQLGPVVAAYRKRSP